MTTFSRTPVPFSPLAEPRFVSGGANAARAAAAVAEDCEFLSCGRDALFRISSLLEGGARCGCRRIFVRPSFAGFPNFST